MINNSPLRNFIKLACDNEIGKLLAWSLWKTSHRIATKSIFDSEYRDCMNGHENYDFRPRTYN